MYPGIPAVEPHEIEPDSIEALEEAAVRYMYVPITDITFWEHQGYSRAHTVDNCTNTAGIAICCMYDAIGWKEWVGIDTP